MIPSLPAARATSALDVHSESLVQEAMDRMAVGLGGLI